MDWRPLHAFVLIAATAAAASVPSLHGWPWLWFAPLAAYAVIVTIVPPFRRSFRPWSLGRLNAATISTTAVITIGSAAVLIAFHCLALPDLARYRGFLPATIFGSVIAAGVLFSFLNALLEELIFRGVLFDAVESQWGAWTAVAATALLPRAVSFLRPGSVEDIEKPELLLLVVRLAVLAVVRLVLPVPFLLHVPHLPQELLQFPAIQPHPAARSAHIDLDPIAADFLHSSLAVRTYEKRHSP